MTKVKKVSKSLWDIIMQPEMIHLPGHLAFFIVLSIFPILNLIGHVASFFNVSVANLNNLANTSLPSNFSYFIVPYIQGKGFDGNVLLFVLIGFFLASNGTHAIILASNSMYHFQNNSYLRRRVKAFLMIVLLIFLFVFILSFLAFGNQLYHFIVRLIDVDYIDNIIFFLFAILKWPFSMFIIYFMIKILYSWTVSTLVFSLYIRYFGHYDIFYGSMANIIIVMLWIYILSFLFVMGMGVNSKQVYIIEKTKKTK